MRLLLLGGTGQVGWELRRALAPLGEVLAPARADADLRRSDELRAFVRGSAADVIVNAAAYTAVDAAETDEAAARATNTAAPGALAEEAERGGALLLHYSTDYVFPGTTATPYTETDAVGPASVYGRTKLAGEEAVRGSGARHVILRTAWVYGLRGSNFLRTMIRLGAERDELRVVADQHGTPTWSRLIAEATALLLTRAADHADLRATYHLTCAGDATWHEFATEIVTRWYGAAAPRVLPITTEEFGAPAPRPRNSRLDCTSIAADFGIRLPDWRDALDLVHADAMAK